MSEQEYIDGAILFQLHQLENYAIFERTSANLVFFRHIVRFNNVASYWA